MKKLTVTTVKKYEGNFYIVEVKPNNNGETDAVKACENGMTLKAFDEFVAETNRYRSIPTPKFSEVKFLFNRDRFTVETHEDIVTVGGHVKVSWIVPAA